MKTLRDAHGVVHLTDGVNKYAPFTLCETTLHRGDGIHYPHKTLTPVTAVPTCLGCIGMDR